MIAVLVIISAPFLSFWVKLLKPDEDITCALNQKHLPSRCDMVVDVYTYFSCFSGLSHIDSSHAYRHMDAKDLTHQHNRLSVKRDISTRLNKILFCFNHSVCSIKVF